MTSRCLQFHPEVLFKHCAFWQPLPSLQKRRFNRSAIKRSVDMEKFNLAKKYHGLEKNVWVEFVKIALEYQPLNLGQGLPDDLVPNYVIDSLSQVLKDPNASLQQYTRGFGHPRLINAIGNVQLFVILILILYARWCFQIVCLQTRLTSLAIGKKSNFYRFLASIFNRRCWLISMDFELQFSANVARFARNRQKI